MPTPIARLEKALAHPPHPAPAGGHDPARNAMACRKDPQRNGGWLPQYALHPDDSLAGLNLAGLGLTNGDWQQLAAQLDLSRLEALNLRGNALDAAPEGLEKMVHLRYLDLCDNRLTEFALPEGLGELEHLWLYGNEFREPVLQARVKQGRHALLEHFQGLAEEGMEELYEARMLIIGEPRAGKTSLRKKLQAVSNPLPTASTKGIDLDIDFEANSFAHLTSTGEEVTFRYQVWDFGGQRQYHPTHQLFFVKSTLYVLVTNTDYDHKNEGDVEFWLETVEKLGAGSPVIHVENKPSDREDSTNWKDIDIRFGRMIRGRRFGVNLDRVNPAEKARFNREDARQFGLLKDCIVTQLKNLEHVGSAVTPTWRKIRDAIAQEAGKTPHISLERYQSICLSCGYSDPDKQLELSKTFHTLGIFLHYQHNPVLRHLVILQNEWAIDAVFAILDSPVLRKQKGHFTQENLPAIWKDNKYAGKRDDLLQLLQEFELCYPLSPAQKGYVAPQCLAKSASYEWNKEENVRVDVTYDFLPRAVITRLIVKMHEHVAKGKQWAWQSGAVFEGKALGFKDTSAEVQEKYRDKKIAVRLRGAYSEDLFREIQSRLYDIHQDFPNLEVDYVIYCTCEDCQQSGKPTPFDYYKHLLRYRRELGAKTVECTTRKRQVKIDDILKGVISPAQAIEDENRQIKIKGKNLTINMAEPSPNSTPEKSNSSIYGALTAFVVILPTLAFCVTTMRETPLLAVLTIVATVLILMLVLVYAGTQSKTFSEDAFVKISERILSKIPGLGSLVTLIKGS